MIFNREFDSSLWMILNADKKYRTSIARIISSIPSGLLKRVQDELKKEIIDNSKEKILTSAIRDIRGNTYMFKINISSNDLKIKLLAWNQFEDDSEYEYDIDLVKFNLEQFDDDISYIGSFFFEERYSSFLLNSLIVNSDGLGYEIYENTDSKMVVQISGNEVYDRIVDLTKLPSDFSQEDLSSKNSFKKLIRGKK